MKNILAWLGATFFFTYQYILRVAPNVIVDDIMEKFSLSTAAIGQLAGSYYISYTLMHIPAGILLDHVGPRKIISIAALCTVIGTIPLVYSSSFALLLAGKILVGAASAVGVLGVFKVIRIYFAEEKFTFLFGLSIFVALIGAMYGGQPVRYSISTFGLNTTFNVILIVGVLIAIFAYFAVYQKKSSVVHTQIKNDLKKLISYRKWLVISIIGGLMIAPIEGFADNWGSKFFSVVYQLNANTSAFLPTLVLFGLAVGSPLLGFISLRFKKYYLILICCAVIMLVGFYGMLHYKLEHNMLCFTLIAIGIASSYQTLIIYLASIFVPKQIGGLTTACSNMVMMIFGYFFHTIIGITASPDPNDANIIVNALSVIPYSLSISIIALILFHKLCGKQNIHHSNNSNIEESDNTKFQS